MSLTRRSTLTAALIAALACGEDRPPIAPASALRADLSGPPDQTLVVAGNIASCATNGDELTAQLVDAIPGTVVALGDNALPRGRAADYHACYDPSWGRYNARTYAALGDRDFDSAGTAAGTFGYFGSRAGSNATGYYSIDVGAWHVIVLNSNGAYQPYNDGSAQDQWLQADLAANPGKCLLAVWHHAYFFSSTTPGWTSRPSIKTLWNRLYAAGLDLVLNGSEHDYERFAPMTPDGVADPVHGIREINVGTGGEAVWAPTVIAPNSEARAATYGVLKLSLSADHYAWQFVPITGQSSSDAGSAACHNATSSPPPSPPPPPPPDIPPTVDAGPDLRTQPGSATRLVFRLAHVENDAPWSYAVEWGDGSTTQGSVSSLSRLLTASHTYGAAGSYRVRVSVTARDGATGWDTLTAFVETPGTPQVFVGAGDVGTCAKPYPLATGRLLDGIPGTVFLLGDNAYPDGSDSDYQNCFAPGWGRHRKRTHPVPGNHDYEQPGAASYFRYFGVAAGDPGKGYYSYDLGSWHIVALNSEINVSAGSTEEQWLRADLAAHPAQCALAYWHVPRFSSGTTHRSSTVPQALWQALYDYGADVVLSGHEHNYERFAPQTADGTADPARGIREFVVGTGGSGAYPLGPSIANSEVSSWNHGVLKLTLRDGAYDWQFIPIPGMSFTDSGSATCH